MVYKMDIRTSTDGMNGEFDGGQFDRTAALSVTAESVTDHGREPRTEQRLGVE